MRIPALPALLCGLLATALLAGCTTRSAAERRIDRNPELYAKLGSRDKELVERGELREGMSRDAVFLAWGRPDMVRTGSREGRSTETWAYFDRMAAHSTSVSIGYGYGGYGRHPFYTSFGVHPRYGYGYGPGWGYRGGTDFGAHVIRTVEFANDRVVAWQRTR